MSLVLRPGIRPLPAFDSPRERERYQTSLHEARHAGFATFCSYRVLDVDLIRQRTLYRPPFTTDGLSFWWDEDRKATQRHMVNVIGCAMAPYVGTVDGLDEGDAAHLQMWREAWDVLPSSHGHAPAPWNVLVNNARRSVMLWLSRPGVEYGLQLLALLLRQRVRIDAAEWVRLMQWPDMLPLHRQRT